MPKKFSYKKFSFFAVLAVILLLIFFNFKGWLALPKDILYLGLQPFLKTFKWVGGQAASGIKIFVTIKDLSSENTRLKKENERLWQQNSLLKDAADENNLLRQRLELGPIENYKFIEGKIVGSFSENGQFFLIDKGSVSGVSNSAAVVTANNFFIGKVIEVNQYWSRVILATDSNSLVNALTEENRASGIVKGEHGIGMIMEMIPIDKEIQVGETVLTSGRDDAIPGGLIVGRIRAIAAKESDIFKQALVEPAVNFRELEKVFILKK